MFPRFEVQRNMAIWGWMPEIPGGHDTISRVYSGNGFLALHEKVKNAGSIQRMFQHIHSLPLHTVDGDSAWFVETRLGTDFYVMIGQEECESDSISWPFWLAIKDVNGKFLRISVFMKAKLTPSVKIIFT